MPGIILNDKQTGPSDSSPVHQVRWLDQQQYLIETYRQIRTNLGQLEAEIEAARLRVTDWSQQHRQRPTLRSRSLSRASLSTNGSGQWSCGTVDSSCTDPSCLQITTDCTESSCTSSCASSTCGKHVPPAIAMSLKAATLISAYLTATSNRTVSNPIRVETNDKSLADESHSN